MRKSVSRELGRVSTTLELLLSNLAKTSRSRKQTAAVMIDAFLVILSLWSAFSLRYGEPFSDFRSTWKMFTFLPVLTVALFMSLGIYRWVIRSSSQALFRQLLKACVFAGFVLVLFIFVASIDRQIPRSVIIIYVLLLWCSTIGVRSLWQRMFDTGAQGRPVAIYGAGAAGKQLYSSLSQGIEFKPVIFIDDNPSLNGVTLFSVPVVNSAAPEFSMLLVSLEVERVILAMPSIGSEVYASKMKLFENSDIPILTIPSLPELVSGKADLNQVRDISISDVLGRSEVPPNRVLLGQCVRGKVVLVTGGGGSIGSELCRQIIGQNPKLLLIVDHSEVNIYHISEELKRFQNRLGASEDQFKAVLCSVVDKAAIEALVREHRVETIYHAAAYKHVPIIEDYPEQGVQVNIFGTLTVLEAAIKYQVGNFVLISTDKAVRPTNAMGASKRVAELVLQAKAQLPSKTKICMVRFGNVLGSSGSVVPKFKRQIDEGGPITLTDPNITRYFMTIPEAAQLVLQASAIASGRGDVFVLDMGLPMKIEELAVRMVELSGKKLQRETNNASDIEIKIEGLRPGEKMYEELFITDSKPTEIQKVSTAEEVWIDWEALEMHLAELRALAKHRDREGVKRLLLELAFLQSRAPVKALELDAVNVADVVV